MSLTSAPSSPVVRSFSKHPEVIDVPNLVMVQIDSFRWFQAEGLTKLFEEVSPIRDYTRNRLELHFVEFEFDEAKHSVAECLERGMTYSAPLRVLVRLLIKETGEIKEEKLFFGDFPLMTDAGTFIISGAERVVVSQLTRFPGVYFTLARDPVSGRQLGFGKLVAEGKQMPIGEAYTHYEELLIETLRLKTTVKKNMNVLEHIEDFRGSYLGVLTLWQGGLTLYGGIAGGIVAGLLAAPYLRLPRWTTADALAPSIALGTAFGRVGCFLNGCCYGRPTDRPWGVVFPADSFAGLAYGAQPVHPAQLYFSAAGLGVFLLAWGLRRRPRVPGVLFWGVLALLALVRIPLDLTRDYEDAALVAAVGPLPVWESQVASAVAFLVSVLMILRLRREARSTPDPGPPAP